MMPESMIAYCGPAALPDDLWTRWNTDPLLLGVLVAFAVLVGVGHSSHRRAGRCAIALMILVFVSPLCALSAALFSARVVHHLILIAMVAPLLALALPLRPVRSSVLTPIVLMHAAILWVWHAPAVYAWGLATVPAYWLMQLSLLGSAWLMWSAILAPTLPPAPRLFGLAVAIGQMGLLGALIVFAPAPLYPVHFASTLAWGLSPLADQQLGGLLMWVPAILPYLGVGLFIAWSNLKPSEPAL